MPEDDVATIEEDLYEGEATDFEGGVESSQIDEVLEALDRDYQDNIKSETEAIPGVESNENTQETAEQESGSEGVLDRLAENGSADSVPPEVIQEFGAGQWGKTYEERGEAAFNFQTGEMVSKDGSVSLTKQIKENATRQHAALHEQVIKGWMETSGGAQLIAFNETTEEGIVIHVTRTWVEQDGQVASETWSKAVPKEEIEPQQPVPADPELSADDYDDADTLAVPGDITAEGFVSFATEPEVKVQEVTAAEAVVTETAGTETFGIELQDMDDADLDANHVTQANVQPATPEVSSVNILAEEYIPTLEQNTDFTPAVEIYDFDDDIQPIEKVELNKAIEHTETPTPGPESVVQPAELQPTEIYEARPEQAERIQPVQAETLAIDILPEGISLVENLFDGDDDIESAVGKVQQAQPEIKEGIEPIEVMVDTSSVTETLENTGGIELVALDDSSDGLEEDVMLKSEMPVILESLQSESPQTNKQVETTGIILLDESEINQVELAPKVLELKPEIADDEEIQNPIAVLKAAISSQDVLKPGVLEQELSGIEIEEIAQMPKAVENNTPIIRVELPEMVIKEPKTETRESTAEIAATQGFESGLKLSEITAQTPKAAESPVKALTAEARQQDIEIPVAVQTRFESEGIALVETDNIQNNGRIETTERPVMLKAIEIDEQPITAKMNLTEAKALGIEIAAIRAVKPAEYNDRSASMAARQESRTSQAADVKRETVQFKPVNTQTVTPKPIARTERQTEAVIMAEKTEIKSQDEREFTPAARPVRIETVKQPELGKENNPRQAEPAQQVVKSSTARERSEISPVFRTEQRFSIPELRAHAQKFNQQRFQISSGRQTSKPIIVKFSQKIPAPFRSAELISKLLTFKPTAVANDDEAISNTIETYIPEFELAA